MSSAPDLKASALAHVSRFMDAIFQGYKDGQTDALRALCSPDITVFGTAAHEKARTVEEFARFLPGAPEDYLEDTSWRFISAEAFIEGRIGWVWGDLAARLKTGGAWIDPPPFRMTYILRLTDEAGQPEDSWEVVHFHGSVPDQQQPDQVLSTEEFQAHSAMLAQKVAERTAELEQSLEELRRMQQQLVQQEKLASLGALTAGIAHEIKNPLNFVNNFAQLSEELVREIEAEHADDPDLRVADVADVLSDLRGNVARIQEHGRRADGIVRSMLAHSRGGRGTRAAVALNPLVDEYVNLAFHGARAQRPGLNANVERSLDAAAGSVEAVPEDVGRVLLNLVSNALYAVHQRHEGGDAPEGYAPTVRVSTHAAGAPRRSPRVGQRRRHPGGGARQDLRALLHDQAGRRGHGPRPLALARPRGGARRHAHGGERRRRDHLHAHAAHRTDLKGLQDL